MSDRELRVLGISKLVKSAETTTAGKSIDATAEDARIDCEKMSATDYQATPFNDAARF